MEALLDCFSFSSFFSLSLEPLPVLLFVFMRKKLRRRWLTWPPEPLEVLDDGMADLECELKGECRGGDRSSSRFHIRLEGFDCFFGRRCFRRGDHNRENDNFRFFEVE